MLQIHALRNLPLAGFTKNSVGLQLLVAGVHSAVSVGVKGAPELPTSGIRENLNLVEQLLHGEFHIQQNTRFQQAVIRKGWRSVTFGVTFLSYLVQYGALKCHFSAERGAQARQGFGRFYSLI